MEDIWKHVQDLRVFLFCLKIKRKGDGEMTEWEVVGVIVALFTFAIAVGTPILKLNTSITRLITRLENLDEGLEALEEKNHKSHERIWKHNEEQDGKIQDHEKRIIILEEKEK